MIGNLKNTLPSLSLAAVSGFYQCASCLAIGDDAIGNSDIGDQYCKCRRCGRAAIVFHPPTISRADSETPSAHFAVKKLT